MLVLRSLISFLHCHNEKCRNQCFVSAVSRFNRSVNPDLEFGYGSSQLKMVQRRSEDHVLKCWMDFGGLEASSVAIFYHKIVPCTYFLQLNSFSVFGCIIWIWIRINCQQKAWIRVRIQLIWIRKSRNMKNQCFLCQQETVSTIEKSIQKLYHICYGWFKYDLFHNTSPCWCVGGLPDILLNATTGNIDGRIHAGQLHVRLTIASCYAQQWPPSFFYTFQPVFTGVCQWLGYLSSRI